MQPNLYFDIIKIYFNLKHTRVGYKINAWVDEGNYSYSEDYFYCTVLEAATGLKILVPN